MTDTIIKKGTIHLGKVDYNRSGRKNCKALLTYELRQTDKGLEFAAQGEVWNPSETDIYCGGQCVDELVDKYGHFPKAKRLKAIWKRYHLNSMKAGSAVQEQYLREHPLDPETHKYPKNHYAVAGAVLAAAGLNPDPTGYRYGHAWCYEPLPQEIIDEVMGW